MTERYWPIEAERYFLKAYEARHYPHFNLSRVLVKQGNFYQAVEEVKKALEIEPDYPLARKELHRLLGQLN